MSLIKDLVLLRTKLLKWSFFGPFFDLKSLKQDSTAEMVLFWSFFYTKVLFFENFEKSPQELYNGSFFGPFFTFVAKCVIS